MRSLVVAGEYPWPLNSGSRLRLATVLRGLTACGPTELFSILPTARHDIDPPDAALGLDQVGHVHFDDRPPEGFARLTGALDPRTPFELPRQDHGASLRALTRFARGHFDLVWYFGIRPFLASGGLLAAPAVLDLVDLEDHKIAARMSLPAAPAPGASAGLRRAAARAFSAEEVRRWRRLQRACGDRAGVTVVCSDLDAERARAGGMSRVEVIPNAYREVADPVGRIDVGEPPTILFQGTLRYPPNADGARFLVREVGPLLQELVPGVRIRLVGTTAPGLAALSDPPNVTLVGQVPEIADELARADLVVVPVRFGSGTRLKVLEAFAHRVPVVSTTLGAEGLGVVDGEHLLVADRAAAIAAACARLLGDEALRRHVTERAHELFAATFAEARVAGDIGALARRAAGVG